MFSDDYLSCFAILLYVTMRFKLVFVMFRGCLRIAGMVGVQGMVTVCSGERKEGSLVAAED